MRLLTETRRARETRAAWALILNHPGHDQKSHGRKGAGRVEGRDLSESLDYDKVAAGTHRGPVDKMLGRIQREQGFDGPVREVDEAEWQRLQSEGATPIFRGVRGVEDGSTAEEIARDYTDGELVPMRGNYGSGTYFTASQETADRYATGEAFGGTVTEGGFTGGTTLHAMLAPDARILDWREHDRLRQEVGGMRPGEKPEGARQRVLADEGRMAATLGYDAIRVNLNDPYYGDEIIVLNRTATVVRA